MKALYIVRLDDACPTNDLSQWNLIEDQLSKFEIKPIVCITPENKHPVLIRSKYDDTFWERAHRWQNKGWLIALHGFSHEFISKKSGIVPLNNFSEFAGVPYQIQLDKIRNGYNILTANGIYPKYWVAPAHTFDKNTLKILRGETPIRIISDGISEYPYNQQGFLWIPQQLWKFQYKPKGVWTICLHPDMLKKDWINVFFKQIESYHDSFAFDINDLIKTYNERKRSIGDLFFFYSFFLKRKLGPVYSSLLKRIKFK